LDTPEKYVLTFILMKMPMALMMMTITVQQFPMVQTWEDVPLAPLNALASVTMIVE